MEEINTIKFIKKTFSSKTYWSVFFASFISFIIILSILLGVAWYYRARVFGYLAKEYVLSSQLGYGSNKITEKIIEKQSVFTQEFFIVDAVKKTNPAVVSIVISKEIPTYEAYIDPSQQVNPFGDLFPGFNFNVPQYRQKGTEKKQIGSGSGFFVSSDGLIVTNKHVVADITALYTVFTNDGKKHIAKIIARDPVMDIAIMKIEGIDFPSVSFGNSDTLQLGQSVIAIGNALGEFKNTVSVGVISGLSRSVTAGDATGKTELLDHVIQTDAAINPGNSGGPLLDLSGRVIGVNVAVAQGSQNIGFALPINSIKGVIESVKATGKIIRPYLGVRYVAINAEVKEKNNLTVDYGVLVKIGATASDLAVIPGSSADKAGIVENDIILEIDGVKLDDKNSLASIIRQKSVGATIKLKILRKGVEKIVPVTLEAAKS